MDKKTTILLDTAGFLAAVHNYKKSEIADLIVALCEFNLYGCTSVKLTDMKKIHFDSIQEVIELRNSRWLKTCEINAQNAKKRTSNRKATAERNSSEPPAPAQSDRPEDKEKENDSELDEDKESESDFINKKDKDKEPENVDKSRYVGAPSVEEGPAERLITGFPVCGLSEICRSGTGELIGLISIKAIGSWT